MAQQTSNVEINIGSKLDAKGFKQAETALSKMGKSARNLAAAFGVTFAAKQLINYTKAATMAAAQDQKSQALLANSLNNLGLAYSKVDVEGFISSLEAQTAITDDVLRPSFAQLAQVTGSVAMSQDLMKLAFDAAAGSGLDYAQTVDILSQAYVGNTKGLKQLNLGLTAAELKAMSFADIQKKIQATFAGAGGKSLETYQGQMDKLALSTGNASEKIGYALLNAIVKISGSKSIDGFTAKIDALATSFANLITKIADYIAITTGQQARAAFSPDRVVAGGRIVFKNPSTGAGNLQLTGGSNMDTQRSQIASAKKAEKLAKERNALLAIDNGLMTRKITLTADQQALEELKKKFDVERVGLYAALNNAMTKEEETRILSLIAIHENNSALAGKIKAEEEAARVAALLAESLKASLVAWGNWQSMIGASFAAAASSSQNPTQYFGTDTSQPYSVSSIPQYMGAPGDIPGITGQRGFNFSGGAPSVIVNVAGSVTAERDLVSAITQGIYNNQASGIPINYSTSYV
jgi:hypothetical protein